MNHDSQTHRGLKQILNSRQASKVLDVRDTATLFLSWSDGREVWISGSNGQCYAVGYGAGGGLYMARTIGVGEVSAMASGAAPGSDGADTVDVRRENVPDAVLNGSGGQS